jgi:hypothetical protein
MRAEPGMPSDSSDMRPGRQAALRLLAESGDARATPVRVVWKRGLRKPSRRDAMETAKECLREAEECDRLAGLARSVATRQFLTVVASHWRRLAERRQPGSSVGVPTQATFQKPN